MRTDRWIVPFPGLFHFIVTGFDGVDAAETPGGNDGCAEDFFFGGADGEIGLSPMGEELEEFGGVFAGGDGAHRGEAVLEGILADGGASFWGAGASGFLRVGAIGVDLGLGCHGNILSGERIAGRISRIGGANQIGEEKKGHILLISL